MDTKIKWIIERLSKDGSNTKKEVREYFKNLDLDEVKELGEELIAIAYVMKLSKFEKLNDVLNILDKNEEENNQTCSN
jgi:hypothetical protein